MERDPIKQPGPDSDSALSLNLDNFIDHLEVQGYAVSILSGQRFASKRWSACIRAPQPRGRCSQIGHGSGDTAIEALQNAYAKALEPESEPTSKSRSRSQPSLTLEDLDL